MSVFGKNLATFRKLRGMSQQELANAFGVSRSAIGNYEQGTRKPNYDDIEVFCDILNCSYFDLTGIPDQSVARSSLVTQSLWQKLCQLDDAGVKCVSSLIDALLEGSK